MFAQVPELDILVNNLGIYGRKAAFEIDDAEWQRFFETNVMSGVRFARHYAPGMAKRGWGRVVFVSSESALNIPKEMIHYGMTKTAQLAISRGLADGAGRHRRHGERPAARPDPHRDHRRAARRAGQGRRASPWPRSRPSSSAISARRR